VKKIILIVFSLMMLAACQQDEEKQSDQTATLPEQSETALSEETQAEEEKAEEEHAHDHHEHQAGPKYQTIVPQATCEKPVVIEFFAYQCPHCYNLEPSAEAWRAKNPDIEFRSVPTTLGNNMFGSLLLVHHAAKKLGVLEKTQHAIFERVHKEQKLFGSQQEAVEFLVAQGANKEEADKALSDQAAIEKALKDDYDLLVKYQVQSVPLVIVNHQYLTSVSAAGGNNEVFEIVDETLQLESSCNK